MAGNDTETAVAGLRDRVERERAGLTQDRDSQAANRRRRAAWARTAIGGAGLLTPGEARKSAENLHGIVALACSRRTGAELIRKSAILDKANMGASDGKSRALYCYTLDPALPDDVRVRRTKRLTRHPIGYLKIADAAAQLAGMDADDIVLRLVNGTRLAEGMDTVSDDFQPEYLDMLAMAVQGQARRITKEINLDWYFRTLESHGISPTLDSWTTEGGGNLWFHYTVPAVELITLELTGQTYRGSWSPNLPDGSEGEAEARTVRPCLRVALTLAPLGSGKEVCAYFMRRHVLVVRGWADETSAGWAEARLAEFNTEVVGWLSQQGRSGNTRGTIRLPGAEWDRFLKEQGLIDYEMDDHEFLEVTPATIAEVLGSTLPDAPWMNDDALHQRPMHVTKSPVDTRIAVLEDVLHHGRSYKGVETQLMALVEKDAREKVASLQAWWNSELAKIEDAFSRMASGDSL